MRPIIGEHRARDTATSAYCNAERGASGAAMPASWNAGAADGVDAAWWLTGLTAGPGRGMVMLSEATPRPQKGSGMSRTAEAQARPRRLLVGIVAVLAALTTLAACGSDSGGGGATPPPASASSASSGSAAPSGGSTVEIMNFMFMPASLTVPVGTTVTWKFDDSTQHTVSADDNSFASSPMASGQTFTHTFASAGTVTYHCSIHPFMKGTVIVK
jgi:plastocyanin